ncbi:MAG: type II toxin-antitoxin system PemK/MazF family toxin [Planctomycetota bacterium]|nr:type II toxin-antitoxin system PemK/MazF family toxin [Planctomycetota bacterium]
MAKPARGEVWLVDMGFAAKVRPALVLSIPIEDDERVLTTVVPHTTSVRGTRFETPSNVRWLKDGSFDAQGIATFPSVKLIRRLGVLHDDQRLLVEMRVRSWLALP